MSFIDQLAERERRDRAERNGHVAQPLTSEQAAEFRRDPHNPKWYASPGDPPTLPPIECITLADLIEQHPELRAPVVEGLVREGETCNVIADPKVGKSWLGYGLGISIAAARDWLGRFPCASGKVLLIDNELHPSTIAHRIPKVGDAMGVARELYDLDFEVVSLRGKLRSMHELGDLIDQIQPGEFKAIVFDAKYRFATGGKSENDNAYQTEVYNLADQYADQTKAALFLIHHSSKGSQSDKRTTDVGAGAGAQSRAADCHLILREHEEEGVVVLEAAVRSFKPVEPLALRWNFPLWVPASGVDSAALKGRKTHGEQRQSQSDRDGMDRIIAALRNGPATRKRLEETIGIGRERLTRLLGMLVEGQHVTPAETIVRGNPTREYSIQD